MRAWLRTRLASPLEAIGSSPPPSSTGVREENLVPVDQRAQNRKEIVPRVQTYKMCVRCSLTVMLILEPPPCPRTQTTAPALRP
jgi:hypothetical protein